MYTCPLPSEEPGLGPLDCRVVQAASHKANSWEQPPVVASGLNSLHSQLEAWVQGAALADLITTTVTRSSILDPDQGSCCHLPPPSRARLVLVLVSVTRPSRGHEWSPDTGRPRPPGHQPPAANVLSIAAGYKIPIIVQIRKSRRNCSKNYVN